MTRIKLTLVRDRRGNAVEITSPRDAFELLRKAAQGMDRECFWRLDLDSRNRVISYEMVSMGTLTASLVHPREFFRAALMLPAAGVIAAHNHPSGDCSPSSDDRETTRRLKAAGELLGVPLVDHIILSGDRFFSFREAGLL